MKIGLIDNEFNIFQVTTLQEAFPNTSFVNGVPDLSFMQENNFGIFKIPLNYIEAFPNDQYKIVEIEPTIDQNTYEITWQQFVPLTAEELTEKLTEKKQNHTVKIQAEAARLISQGVLYEKEDVRKAYRQALSLLDQNQFVTVESQIQNRNRVSKVDFWRLFSVQQQAMITAWREEIRARITLEQLQANASNPQYQLYGQLNSLFQTQDAIPEYIELDHPDTSSALWAFAFIGVFGNDLAVQNSEITRILFNTPPS